MNTDYRFLDLDELKDNRAVYRAWHRAYSASMALYEYMFERWRNDPALYRAMGAPGLGNKYEVFVVNV
jgi:hypothetical protein